MMLRLHGCPVVIDDVMRQIVLGPRGASIRALSDAARTLGLETEVRKGTIVQLGKALPAIAHLKNAFGDSAPLLGGHFVVVVRCEKGLVTVLDGTTAEMASLPFKGFEKLWSGYVLVPHAISYRGGDASLFASLGLWILTATMIAKWKGGRGPIVAGGEYSRG
jgi:ABC-type bacteriocin/lantibiotic exporter with double-glycine peptidase domain